MLKEFDDIIVKVAINISAEDVLCACVVKQAILLESIMKRIWGCSGGISQLGTCQGSHGRRGVPFGSRTFSKRGLGPGCVCLRGFEGGIIDSRA